MTTEVYDKHGVRFEYPAGWEVEEADEGEVATVAVSVPDGLGFAVITTDVSCPDPESAADQALEALREEYAGLDATPVLEAINGQTTTGHDVEFFALDMTNSARIRCFRTPRRTVLVFAQWSDLGDEETPDQIRHIFRTLEETEEDDEFDPAFDDE